VRLVARGVPILAVRRRVLDLVALVGQAQAHADAHETVDGHHPALTEPAHADDRELGLAAAVERPGVDHPAHLFATPVADHLAQQRAPPQSGSFIRSFPSVKDRPNPARGAPG